MQCAPPQPFLPADCPVISVACPDSDSGPNVTFTANISGDDPDLKVTFNWTVTAGVIASGQGTPIITVDTTGFEGQSFSAAVEVGGLPGSCANTASCTTNVCGLRSARKVDEYSSINFADEKGRLDSLAAELQKEPTAMGYILSYAGRRAYKGEAQKRGQRAKSYLVKERGFTLEGMANIVSGALAAVALATIAAGWISDRLIARGASPTVVRKSIVVGGLALSSVILPVAFVASAEVSVTLLLLACMAFGTYTSNHWAITQTLAGPRMAGRWTSLQNGVGNVSGIIAPWLAGTIVALSGSSKLAFVISALIVLAGAAIWGLAVGPVEEVRWRNH